MLKQLQPTEGLFKLAEAMFKKLWDHRLNNQKQRKRSFENEVKKIEQKLDFIVEAEEPTVVKAYEKRIKKLEREKVELQEKAQKCTQVRRGYRQSVRTVMKFLANPCNLWDSENLQDKCTVLKLVFSEQLGHAKREGFRTAKTTLPFKALGVF